MEELQLKLKENERIRQELEAKMVQSAHYGKLLLFPDQEQICFNVGYVTLAWHTQCSNLILNSE